MMKNKLHFNEYLNKKLILNGSPKLSIDKLGFRIDPEHCKACDSTCKAIKKGFYNSVTSFMAGWQSPKVKPGSYWSHRWTPLNMDATLSIKYGYTQNKRLARLDFNPFLVQPAGWFALEKICKNLYADGLNELMAHCIVRRIDFACDVAGIDFTEHVFFDTKLVDHQDKYGKLGTYYIGSLAGGRRFACYDKGRQVAKKFGIHLAKPLLRLEARLLTSQSIEYWKEQAIFNGIKNPFESLVVLHRNALKGKKLSGPAHQFRSLLKQGYAGHRAYREAVALTASAAERALLKKLVTESAPSWWKPTTIWSQQVMEAIVDVYHWKFTNIAADGSSSGITVMGDEANSLCKSPAIDCTPTVQLHVSANVSTEHVVQGYL